MAVSVPSASGEEAEDLPTAQAAGDEPEEEEEEEEARVCLPHAWPRTLR